MRLKIIFMLLVVWALATVASAQTKISGTAQCGKGDPEYSIQVGDRPNHSFVISQDHCTWTKPMEIGGTQNKEGVGTEFAEISGNTPRGHYYFVDTMTNGDKAYWRQEFSLNLKDGVPQSGDTKWTFVGGTGKLKGLKGKGACKLTSATADGSSTWECEGEYELPK
jgi:hypothetical protein